MVGGYCAEVGEGLVLATFGHPAAAIRWALASIQVCMAADWAPELLAHEACEEISIRILHPDMGQHDGSRLLHGALHAPRLGSAGGRGQRSVSQAAGGTATPKLTLFRGPRIKVRVCCAALSCAALCCIVPLEGTSCQGYDCAPTCTHILC